MSDVIEIILNGQFIRASQRAMQHTCQLFYAREKSLKAVGSGVLVQAGTDYFLITAAHVLEKQFVGGMCFHNGTGLRFLGGQLEITAVPKTGGRDDDMFDMAIMKLEPEVVSDLKGRHTFLDVNQVLVNHLPGQCSQYLVCGYPAKEPLTKITWDGDKVTGIRSTGIHIKTSITNKEVMNAMNCKECYHLNLDYTKSNAVISTTGEKVFGPDITGVSGGGVWFIPFRELLMNPLSAHKLVGIAIRYVPFRDQIIVVVKIDLVTETLRQKFGVDIPQSKTVSVEMLS